MRKACCGGQASPCVVYTQPPSQYIRAATYAASGCPTHASTLSLCGASARLGQLGLCSSRRHRRFCSHCGNQRPRLVQRCPRLSGCGNSNLASWSSVERNDSACSVPNASRQTHVEEKKAECGFICARKVTVVGIALVQRAEVGDRDHHGTTGCAVTLARYARKKPLWQR